MKPSYGHDGPRRRRPEHPHDSEYYDFLERVAAVDSNPTAVPLRAGAAMRCDDYGAFGLAWKFATTLGGSYNRAQRYALVLTSVSLYEVEPTRRGVHPSAPGR